MLIAQKWEEADRETDRIIFSIVNKEEGDLLTSDDVYEFPIEDLQTIDRLWTETSNAHFGFSIQKRIWEDCGSPKPYTQEWDKFCIQLGWKRPVFWSSDYLDDSKLKRTISLSPKGEIPWYGKFQETYFFFRQDL
jgi:hypothetical protein